MQNKTMICPPWMNTTAIDNPEVFFNELINNILGKVNVCIPCKIMTYDRAKHEAMLKVLFNWKLRDGRVLDGCYLYNITIMRFMAGGMLIDFPIRIGDTGWLIACDNDSYDVKRERTQRLPSSADTNCYKGGFWIPDQFGDTNRSSLDDIKDLKIDEEDYNRVVIQTRDGSQKISIGDNGAKIQGNEVTIQASSVKVKADNIVFDGAVQVKGAATGLITETTIAQVQNGIVVGINNT